MPPPPRSPCTVFRRAVVWGFLALGIYEFVSAARWWADAAGEHAAAEGMLPRAVTGEAFRVGWCVYLVTLGLVRVGVWLQPGAPGTLWMSACAHVPEILFWWYWATKPAYRGDTAGVAALAWEVLCLRKGLFAALVLLGPSMLLGFHFMLIATAAADTRQKPKTG